MLNLAEYVAAKAELYAIGDIYADKIRAALGENPTKQTAIDIAKGFTPDYITESRELLDKTFRETAKNSILHYATQLGLTDLQIDEIVEDIVQKQYNTAYYGATLKRRLKISENMLNRRIIRSAQIKPEHVAGIFTQTYPFGAQVALDTRLLVATIAKIENDTAVEMANRADVPLIRWTLSNRHKQECQCDDYASNIDDTVVRYIQGRGWNIDPKGIYFTTDLPDPPHPNCQCEYGMVQGGKQRAPGVIKRAANRIRRILRSLRRK